MIPCIIRLVGPSVVRVLRTQSRSHVFDRIIPHHTAGGGRTLLVYQLTLERFKHDLMASLCMPACYITSLSGIDCHSCISMGKKIPFYSESARTQYTSQANHVQCNRSAASQQQFAYSCICQHHFTRYYCSKLRSSWSTVLFSLRIQRMIPSTIPEKKTTPASEAADNHSRCTYQQRSSLPSYGSRSDPFPCSSKRVPKE